MCKSPSKSSSPPGLRWTPPSQKAPSWTPWVRGCFRVGDLGVSLRPPRVFSSTTRSRSLLHAPKSGYVPGSSPSPKPSWRQTPAMGLRAEPKSVGHSPACPAPRLCHCLGLQGCKFPLGMADSHLARAKRLKGKEATLSQPREIARLLKSTVGRKGKGNRKSKCLQADFITNQMEMSQGLQHRGAPTPQVAPGQCSAPSLGYHRHELF